MSVQLHECIRRYNVLETPGKNFKDFFEVHPTVFKVALFVFHIFRAAAMFFLMKALPFTMMANFAICFTASLLYRLMVERPCPYKFALPALAGACAYSIGEDSLHSIAAHTAFSSLASFAQTIGLLIPLTAYITYIALTINYDVNVSNYSYESDCCCYEL